MPVESRKQLQTYFETGDIPTQDQFYNVLDSYVHKLDDGIYFLLDPRSKGMNVGFGFPKPNCPITVKANINGEAICIVSNDERTEWHQEVNPSIDGKEMLRGFSLAEGIEKSATSRLFIEGGTGRTGIGTNKPTARLHITDASTNSATSLKIQNAMIGTVAGVKNRAWQLGHIHDPSLPKRIGTFSVMEETISAELVERITVLPERNVGINEEFPDVTLQVNRDPGETLTKVQLMEGSGIVMVGGLIGNNLALDYQTLQARSGNIVAGTSTLAVKAATLNLNMLGGDVHIHSGLDDSQQVIMKENGNVGIGTVDPSEQLHLTGAVIVGQTSTTSPEVGTIRYNTTTADIEGYVAGDWYSLTGTSSSGYWQSAGTDMIRYNTADAKVGIGVATPTAALHVENNTGVTDGNSVGAYVRNSAVITGSGVGVRAGLQVVTDQQWSSSVNSKNIGIMVQASGMTDVEKNIAASLNGNVVVGSLTANMVGDGGNYVLAIQDGAAPAGPVSGSDSGIQIYSAPKTDPDVSLFNVMNGDGTIITLYRQANMTASNTSTVNSGDATTDAVINNLRTRINQLETIMKNLGVLHP